MPSSLSKKMIPKAFKSKKLVLLKQTVVDLESDIAELNAQLESAVKDGAMTEKELQRLRSGYDILKVKSAKEIADLEQKVNEEQTIREQERKVAEGELQELREEHEKRLRVLQSECDHRVEVVSRALAREMRNADVRQLQKDEVAKLQRDHEKTTQEMKEKIERLEKERRSLKILVQLCRSAITRRILGRSKVTKMFSQAQYQQLLTDS
eukprot:CAMPEP_0172490960 /NCGR_PEP_ID=MMETSP1066-20121228/21605_1 /TAXON_ID=671091 /ORGANISM="Coscinodiscus wailesii, Strain CCMP2513" /LENGTH=208 /DNA_ID=CAMNT_0013259719 /DNA_START=67 /DNA_END=693 /DNA_ORIENTATION=+